MSAIPLYDLDEVATKRDLAVLRAELTVELTTEWNKALHAEIGTLRQSVERRFDRLLYAMIAMPLAILGGVFGLLRYVG